MTKEEVIERAKGDSAPRAVHARNWRKACVKSGLQPANFGYEVRSFRNILDGRCPDGCCGAEDRALWAPTPAEWVILANRVAEIRQSRS